MKVAIIGSNGIIGKGILDLDFNNRFLYYSRTSEVLYFNILDNFIPDSLSLLSKGDLILFLPAISKPSECESNKLECLNFNYTQTVKFIEEFTKRGLNVLFASSDQVYGDSSLLKYEFNEVAPQNFYAYSKILVEEYFQDHENFRSLRFSQCINGYDSFSQYCKNCYEKNYFVELFSDYHRNIFSSELLHTFLTKLLLGEINFNQIPKVLNFGSISSINRVDFSKYLKNHVIIDTECSQFFLKSIKMDTTELQKLIHFKYEFNFESWYTKLFLK